MTPVEQMRRAVTMFEATGQVGELSRAQAWATIAIAEHLERTCHAQATPPSAATAADISSSAKRGSRTSKPAKSTAAEVTASSNPARNGNSTTPTTEPATSDQPTNAATTQPEPAKHTTSRR